MKSYPPEFKVDAVALYLSDPARTYASVARDLGITARAKPRRPGQTLCVSSGTGQAGMRFCSL
ncbi:transposase [Nonomuraea purpurea]|uniref:Transposase n=1 Tax=Nonomuraea purpurea TaxID=1849276 RepID=A0ABV8GST2_9ACTN